MFYGFLVKTPESKPDPKAPVPKRTIDVYKWTYPRDKNEKALFFKSYFCQVDNSLESSPVKESED